MPWITFERDFDFSPVAHRGRVTLAYKAGTTANVTRACADQALAAGAARPTNRPRRSSADGA